VTGADGQAVVGAQVVARNTATGVSRGALTDSEGRYAIPLLQTGPYSLRITSIGFSDAERSGVNASAGIVTTVDLTLSVQAVAVEGIEAIGIRNELAGNGVATRVSTEQAQIGVRYRF
jgi:hypothetical protein